MLSFRPFLLLCSTCGLTGGLLTTAWAQAVPDAGQLQRQLDQELAAPPSAPPPPTAPDAQVDRSGVKVTLRRVVIEGASLIPDAELAAQFEPWLGQSLSLGELQAAAQSLVAYYRERGWFVRVVLPPQDVSDGTLRVRVIEGRFGDVRLVPGDTRANADFVSRVVGARLTTGEPYSLAALERGLLLANDLPGIQADGVLMAGSAPGTSDLQLTVRDRAWTQGQVSLSNLGGRSTGEGQLIGQLAVNDPSGRGDQFTATAVGTQRMGYGLLGYSLPVGADGLRFSVGANLLRYRLGKSFSDLDARGRSHTVQAGLVYPLKRSTTSNVNVGLQLASRQSRDDMLGFTLRERRINTAAWSLSGDQRDLLGRGGLTTWRTELVHGRASLRLEDDALLDAAGRHVAGSFTRLQFEVRHEQWLSAQRYLRVRTTGQWGADNLDSSQQFGLGGPYGVRGYPANEGSGDSGALLQLEAHQRWGAVAGGVLDAYAFLDAGVVRQNHQTWAGWQSSSADRNTYALYAAGLGAGWRQSNGLGVDVVFAVPLGHNPTRVDHRRNSDGSRHGPRLWLTASYVF